MRRLLALPLLVALTAPAFVPAAVGAAAACASEPGPHAALVIDTGARELELCVRLSGASVSGLELIRLAAQQHGLDYALGFGGQAVCRLGGVGPSGGDCFADYPNFWGFWRGGPGGWSWSATGPGSSSVADGGMQGWSWGSGDSGATHPPPATAIDDVCPPPPEPEPEPEPAPATPGGGSGGESGESAGGTVAPSARPSGSAPADSPSPRPSKSPATDRSPRATTVDDPALLAAGGGEGGDGGESPVGSFAAIGAVIVLALGGAAMIRRRGKAGA
jgi:hypothetical protein